MLEVEGFQAVCFSAPVVRVLKEDSVRRDRQLANLGPDLLAETFDAGVAVARLRALADWPLDVAVMHQGRIVEMGPAQTILQSATHPYTQALLRAVPRATPGQPIPALPRSGQE